ncbi:hypothetical protein VTK73DRAFT_8721 [Phialemonium thermophilum]|uniref:PinX1-related protein 1 n=1 Tax=Phialemonium thermophilum TaxID=223376 RepID=A0ABR3XNZ9_9PEZI
MGLAAARKRRKVGLDPNNNLWARNTDTFGQKILRAHGWEPGQFLGAKDAAHAQWHTAASASHIRVVMKEDTLGLGAKRNNGDQCTGLDDFQDLLGRLNGKAEDVIETERKAREDVKLSLYVQRKYGAMRFVKGGWLVGDQVQEDDLPVDAKEPKESQEESQQPAEKAAKDTREKDTKKRRLEKDEGSNKDSDGGRKKSKKRKIEESGEPETDKEKRRREKKEKKRKKKDTAAAEEGDDSTMSAPHAETTPKIGDKKKKRKGKAASGDESSDTEKDSSKKDRRRKKAKEAAEQDRDVRGRQAQLSSSEVDSVTPAASATNSQEVSRASTPAGSGYSTPLRHLSRKRFIEQKRMAFMDPTALKQIFMIKSES